MSFLNHFLRYEFKNSSYFKYTLINSYQLRIIILLNGFPNLSLQYIIMMVNNVILCY